MEIWREKNRNLGEALQAAGQERHSLIGGLLMGKARGENYKPVAPVKVVEGGIGVTNCFSKADLKGLSGLSANGVKGALRDQGDVIRVSHTLGIDPYVTAAGGCRDVYLHLPYILVTCRPRDLLGWLYLFA